MMRKSGTKKNLTYISGAQHPVATETPAQFHTDCFQQGGQTHEMAPTHDQIARRAYEIYVEQGCPQDKSQQHWQQAERETRNPGRASMSSES